MALMLGGIAIAVLYGAVDYINEAKRREEEARQEIEQAKRNEKNDIWKNSGQRNTQMQIDRIISVLKEKSMDA